MSKYDEAFWRLLGLATRAGKIVTGTEAVEQTLRRKKAKMIIMAEDAREQTKSNIALRCEEMNIPCIIQGNRQQIGHWTGKDERIMAAVMDSGFAGKLYELAGCADRQETGKQDLVGG